MRLVPWAFVGTAIGLFLTHPPEWFYRGLAVVLGIKEDR